MPPTALHAGGYDRMNVSERKVYEAGALVANFGFCGVIWLSDDLTVESTYGRLVDFVKPSLPVADSILPIIGLENEITARRSQPGRVLEVPAVAVATADGTSNELNFTFFWNLVDDKPRALVYKSTSQTELELALAEDPSIVLGAGSAAMLPRLAPILDAGLTPARPLQPSVAALASIARTM